MRTHRTISTIAGAAAAAAAVAGLVASSGQAAQAADTSAYSAAVAADDPTAVLSGTRDLVSGSTTGTLKGDAATTTLPNGDTGVVLDGKGDHVSFPSSPKYSIATTGVLTVEYLMRPDTLQFADEEGSGYVYVLGKGDPNRHEWYGRMYSRSNDENRPNRISAYAFNPKGGLGAGSYSQESVTTGRWIHVTVVFNSTARSSAYPSGYVKLYRDGKLKDTDSLADYGIKPVAGSAPLRLGTGYLASYFKGAIGPVAFYDRELSATRVAAHQAAR
ncbi:LamG domain-containing protein [Aeromicrobium fastidiosum]|uniref:LamG domain-containing protein n=1 Tax=Aeromicrobium fastidiosum TaxID=52699 RepID=UPI002023846B|nr:LamG domain-containing protein [Aeromicrobium fastidiosum]MCL8253080.1 LamG domain-containing protein [Aeromicrobium fastidiosum]